jgi:hypothetical protein
MYVWVIMIPCKTIFMAVPISIGPWLSIIGYDRAGKHIIGEHTWTQLPRAWWGFEWEWSTPVFVTLYPFLQARGSEIYNWWSVLFVFWLVFVFDATNPPPSIWSVISGAHIFISALCCSDRMMLFRLHNDYMSYMTLYPVIVRPIRIVCFHWAIYWKIPECVWYLG